MRPRNTHVGKVWMLVAAALWLSTGCTSVNVQPIAPDERITSVLIEENPRVWRSDFVDVLVEGFRRHGIDAQVIQPNTAPEGAYVVRYTARQKWDMAMYMSDATIWIYRNNREVAKAVYHLKGGGGFALTKWQGTQTKIDPVIDELLANVGTGAVKSEGASQGAPSTAVVAAAMPAQSEAVETTIEAMCDLPSQVDRAECRGELTLGMTTNEVLKKLGRPDEMSADGTVLRYGDRYLVLDEKSRLVGISHSPPAAG